VKFTRGATPGAPNIVPSYDGPRLNEVLAFNRNGPSDWVELYNANGAVVVRAVVSQRMMTGSCFMYHGQEKLVNTPVSPRTGVRGIHNSLTRIIPKPTHMIGGYAQLSWGMNYYGTIGSNRDDSVVIRKLETVDWMQERAPEAIAERSSK
jgi:nitrate reductase alpha subunit